MLLVGLLLAGSVFAQSPPVEAPPPSAPANVPALPAADAKIAEAPSAAVPAKPAVTAPAAIDNGAGEFYGPVKPAESLWSIANRMRPNKQITTEQVLVAIYRSNPRAFYGSINSLNEGAVLRVPNIAEMTALDAAGAHSELQRLWSAKPGTAAASSSQPLIDPLKIAPPPPADGEPDAAAVSGESQTPVSAPATDETPVAVTKPNKAANNVIASAQPAGEVAVSTPAQSLPAPANAELSAMLAQLRSAVHALLVQGSVRLANATLDQLLGLSFAVVAVLALLLFMVRRPSQPQAAVAAPSRVMPMVSVSAEPVLLRVDPPDSVVSAEVSSAPSPAPEDHVEIAAGSNDAHQTRSVSTSLGADPISTDELGTKLDLARAYVEMGEKLLARVLLREVLQQGDDAQRADAEALLTRVQ